MASVAIVAWTYMEVGEVVIRNSGSSLLALAYWVSVGIPVRMYLYIKRISLSYVGDTLFRLSVAAMIWYSYWL
ncbi:MAG: hypothetical protein ACLRZ7_10440 [Lachnospiraceae bacterium]